MSRELVALSRSLGRQTPHWVQGPGANVSIKKAGYLFVKASGIRLDEMRAARGWVRIRIDATAAGLRSIGTTGRSAESAYARRLAEGTDTGSGARPSMEAGMHLALPGRVVIHFHSHAAVLMAHHHGRAPVSFGQWLRERWRGDVQVFPPTAPGLELYRRVARHPRTGLFLFANHGLLLQGRDARILRRWRRLERTFLSAFGYPARASRVDRPAPLRLYFPDSAVFYPRIRRILRPAGVASGERLWRPRPGARRRDASAWELWKVTELLYHACPSLAVLPRRLASRIPGLPTELYRLSVKREAA